MLITLSHSPCLASDGDDDDENVDDDDNVDGDDYDDADDNNVTCPCQFFTPHCIDCISTCSVSYQEN